MNYIVYKTINLVNNKEYIGVHSTVNPEIFDGYLGCGCYNTKPSSWEQNTKSPFPKAIIKYGPENFKREVLYVYPYTEEGENSAYNKEAELVNEDWIKSDNTYNIMLGGKIGRLNDQNKPVRQYDLQGNYIKTWRSIKEAMEVYKGHIGEVCRYTRQTACEFQWRFDEENIDKLEEVKIQRKTVYQFDLQGNLIKVWKSLYEAANSFTNPNSAKTSIMNNCNGKTRQSKGYYWSYKCKFEYTCKFTDMPIACYTPEGIFIKSFTNVKEACEEYKLKDYSGIKAVIQGKHKLCVNLRWRYFYGDTHNIKSLYKNDDIV